MSAELKIAVATDIGASVEDAFEAARKDMYRQEGAVTSFGQAAKACEMLCEVVNKDLEEGKIADMAQAEAIKLWLARAANAQRSLLRNAENSGMSASGKVSALEGTIKLIEKYRRAEELKIAEARILASIAASTDGQAPAVRTPPDASIKAQRLAESQAEAAAVAQSEQATILPAKRRGRPAKAKG